MNTGLNNRERLKYLNMLAEKDMEKAAALAEKDEQIEYWKRAAEQAIRSRRRALYNHSVQVKQFLEYAVCLLLGSAAFAAVCYTAISFWNWANQ